jgi:4-nitrophenyl phosphatase
MPDSPVGTIVFDLDGVIYLDSEGIPGAGDSLASFERDGWQLLFATNNSTKTPRNVVDHIVERTGFEASPEQAITSAGSAAHHVAQRYSSAYVVGSHALESMLRAAGVESRDTGPVDSVVVGLDLRLSYHKVDVAARAIRGGAAFVATNLDSTYPTPTGLAPGAGSVVAAIAEAAQTEAVNCGKPTRIFTDLVRERVASTNVWMIGDRPETDIAMAKAAGWTSVLTLSGVTDDLDSVPTEFAPDHVLTTIAELPRLIRNPPVRGSGGG